MVELVRKILEIFADNHLFDEGVELIGSWCFLMYQKHLGAKKFPLRTQDIDFLVPTPYRGKDHPDFIRQLEALGFRVDFKRNGSLYLWSAELKIEFITTEKGRGTDKAVKINKLGVNAIPLRFVGLLLENPIPVVDEGIRILIPNPANFCLHKLIIASRRLKVDKSEKDLQQAISTSVIVDKKELCRLFIRLPKKWKAAILKMLNKAKIILPLLIEEINNLELTLQDFEKR